MRTPLSSRLLGTNRVVYTMGVNDEDYTDIQAFLDGPGAGDNVGDQVTPVLQINSNGAPYNQAADDNSASVRSSLYPTIIECVPGHECRDSSTSGVRFEYTAGNAHLFSLSESHTYIHDIGFKFTCDDTSGSHYALFNPSGSDKRFVGLFFYESSNIGTGVVTSAARIHGGHDHFVANCIAKDNEHIGFYINGGNNHFIANCLSTGNLLRGFQGGGGSIIFYNNSSINNGTNYFTDTTSVALGNISDDGTIFGIAPPNQINVTPELISTNNYRLEYFDSIALDNGVDLRTGSYPFDDDMDGRLRKDNWDIGPFEQREFRTALSSRRSGTNRIVYTMGVNDEDYTDISAFASGPAAVNTTTSEETPVLFISSNGAPYNQVIAFSGGWQHSESFPVIIETMPGHENLWGQEGVRFELGSGVSACSISDSYIYVHDIGIKLAVDDTSTNHHVILTPDNTSQNKNFVGVQVYESVNSGTGVINHGFYFNNGDNIRAILCLARDNDYHGIRTATATYNREILSCHSVNNGQRNFMSSGTSTIIANSVAENAGTDDFNIADALIAPSGNNISSDGTATGTNSIINQTISTRSATDLRLDSNDIIAMRNGQSLSGYSGFAFDDDLHGNLRDVLWDIGGIQFPLMPQFNHRDWAVANLLELDSTQIPAAQQEFTVLVSITSNNLKDHARSDGLDIRFTSANGYFDFQHELVSYDNTTGTLVAYVKFSDIFNFANPKCLMWYGNPSHSTPQTHGGAYASHWIAAHHLNKDPSGSAPQFPDSTTNGHDLTSGGSMTADDLVAGQHSPNEAIDFDGGGDFLSATDTAALSPTDITVLGWAKADVLTGNHTIASKWASGQTSWVAYLSGTDLFVAIADTLGSSPSHYGQSAGVTFAVDTWYHLAFSYDSSGTDNPSRLPIYIDGTQNSPAYTGTIHSSLLDSSADFKVGNVSDLPGDFDGLIDEAWVSNTVLSANYIQTLYNSQKSPGTFITVGQTIFSSFVHSSEVVNSIATTVSPQVELGSIVRTPPASSALSAIVNPSIIMDSLVLSPVVSYAASTVAPSVRLGSIVISPAVESIAAIAGPNAILGSIVLTPGITEMLSVTLATDPVLGNLIISQLIVSMIASTVAPTIEIRSDVIQPVHFNFEHDEVVEFVIKLDPF